MRARRLLAGLSVLTTFGLMAAACGDDSDSKGSDTPSAAADPCKATTTGKTGEGKKVGLLFDVTGRGDKSFNDSAACGLDKAKGEFGITGNESTPTAADGSDRPERLKNLVTQGNGLVIGVGFLWADALGKGAKDNASTSFAIVDDSSITAPNVSSLVFAEEQGSYLVGVAAALKSKSGKIGFIGGVQNDLIKKFEAGFVAGVKATKSSATVDVKYITQPPDFSGFNDPAKGKAIAKAMYDSGIDTVYHAAGGSGKGLFEAAKETGKKAGDVWAIGVDSDQALTASADTAPFILTSMLKRVDVAVYETIKDYVGGAFKAGTRVFDLKVDGVGYATTGGHLDDIKDKLEAAKADIISGKITVPAK
ncbi:MAG: BMP family protein [Acidimicrobiia bacterium]